MEHTAQDGSAKLLRECTLPLTGTRVVQRVITDLCVLDVTPGGFELVELADGTTREQVTRQTDAAVGLAGFAE
jgi:3-oxoacid CoA-transferase subunit B